MCSAPHAAAYDPCRSLKQQAAHRHGRLRSILVLLQRNLALTAGTHRVLPAERALARVSQQAHQRQPAVPKQDPLTLVAVLSASALQVSCKGTHYVHRHAGLPWGIPMGDLSTGMPHLYKRAKACWCPTSCKEDSNVTLQTSRHSAHAPLGEVMHPCSWRTCCGLCCPGAAALSPPAAPRPRRVAAPSVRCFASCRGIVTRSSASAWPLKR